ncbi:hypothetical protein V8G54_031189 [Vigna mungo]|uniref:glucan endo-1,3-beta-D-glucosidase n=1 Tax=Vigna mungo TaxID=3915 RepID=A0AAQ3MXR8_VIGMU
MKGWEELLMASSPSSPKIQEQILGRKYKPQAYSLVADFRNLGRRSDSNYMRLRCFDLYKLHSWAGWLTEFADGRNQESTSEAVNAYFSAALMGLAYGDTQLIATGSTLAALEIHSAQMWRIWERDINCTRKIIQKRTRCICIVFTLLQPRESSPEQDANKTLNSHSASLITYSDCEEEDLIPMTQEMRQRTPSAYNCFIKEEINRLKAESPDMAHKEAFSTAAKITALFLSIILKIFHFHWANFPPTQCKGDDQESCSQTDQLVDLDSQVDPPNVEVKA